MLRSLFAICALLVAKAVATDYCRKDLCPLHRRHIACENYGDFDESCGDDVSLVPFNRQLRGQLLSRLNGFRNAIALGKYKQFKPAASMAVLSWHDELAGLAKFAVRRCENFEEFCGNTNAFQYASYIYGSTSWLYSEKTPRAVLEWVLNFWMKDRKLCNMRHINGQLPPKDEDCRGYFTQLVQDLAAHVGCALLRRRRSIDKLLQYSLVCQFSRGKVIDQPIYRESVKPAKYCQAGPHAIYKGLCSPDEPVNANMLG